MSKLTNATETEVAEVTAQDVQVLNSLFDSEYVLSRIVNNRPSDTLKMVMSLTNTAHAEVKLNAFNYLVERYNLQVDVPVAVGDYTLTLPANQTTHAGTPCKRVDISKKDTLALTFGKWLSK